MILNQNKRKFFYLSAVVLIIVIIITIYYINKSTSASIYNTLNSPIKIINVDKDSKVYNNVDELEKDADLVVEVKATNKSKHINKEEDGGIPLWYWTESEVEVNKVFSNSTGVKKGDTITIYEPYTVFVDKANITTMINSNSYKKIVDQKKYVFFLKKHKDGGYMPLGVQQGKINLDESDLDNEKLSKSAKEKYYK